MDEQWDESWCRFLEDGPDRYYEQRILIYATKLYNIVLGWVKNKEDANDIMQDALLKAYVALRRYFKLQDKERIMKPFPWLKVIAFHAACDYWKHNHPVQYISALEEIFSELEDPKEQPDRLVEEEESRQELLELIAKLPDSDQNTIQLHYFQSLGYPELAERLNCTEDTARQRVHRAIVRLHQLCNKTRKVR